jgi:hypothetical protein
METTDMRNIKIQIYDLGSLQPKTSIKIPNAVLKFASKFLPQKATKSLQEKSIDVAEVVKLANEPNLRGTLVEVEDAKSNERVVVSLE